MTDFSLDHDLRRMTVGQYSSIMCFIIELRTVAKYGVTEGPPVVKPSGYM